jgi:hypothetical protein
LFNILFSYYPFENNQPELLNSQFSLCPEISGDTIVFSNLLLWNLFREMKMDSPILNESSSFLISRDKGLYKFSKITGNKIIPKVMFFKKYSNQYPKNFKYQAIKGFDKWDDFVLEINGKDSINVWLHGSPNNPYLYEQKTKNEMDNLFIASYLNFVCENRYDTITLNSVCLNSVSVDEILVYNDSVFLYNTYFYRYTDNGLLINYFRSKIDKKIHHLEKYNSEKKSPLYRKKFKDLPIAVENWKILAPPLAE